MTAHVSEPTSRRHAFQFMPAPTPEEYARLKADIAANGVELAVVVDEAGDILDGYTRTRIVEELRTEGLDIELPTRAVTGLSDPEKRLLAARLNLHRRHLTDVQRAMLGRMLEPDLAAEAHERMSQGGRGGVEGSDKRRTVDAVATFVGLGSGRTYERYRGMLTEIEDRDPDTYRRLAAGEIRMRDVQRAARPSTPKRARVVDDEPDTEDWEEPILDVSEHRTQVWGKVIVFWRSPNPHLRTRTIGDEERTYRREAEVQRRVIEFRVPGDPLSEGTPDSQALEIGKAAGTATMSDLRVNPLR